MLAERNGTEYYDPSGLLWDEISLTSRCSNSIRIDAESVYLPSCNVGFVEIEVQTGRLQQQWNDIALMGMEKDHVFEITITHCAF